MEKKFSKIILIPNGLEFAEHISKGIGDPKRGASSFYHRNLIGDLCLQ